MALWKKMVSPHLRERKLGTPNTEGPQEIRNFLSPWLQDIKKFLSPLKKYLWVGGVYTTKKIGKKYRLPERC